MQTHQERDTVKKPQENRENFEKLTNTTYTQVKSIK